MEWGRRRLQASGFTNHERNEQITITVVSGKSLCFFFILLYKTKNECDVYFIIMLSRALDVLFTRDLVLSFGIVRIFASFFPRFFQRRFYATALLVLFYFCLFSSLFYYDIDVISALLTRHFSDYKSVSRGHDGRCERTRRSVPFGGCQSLQKPLSGFIRRMSTRPLVRLRGDRYLLGHGPRCHQSGLGYLLLFHYVSFSFAFFPPLFFWIYSLSFLSIPASPSLLFCLPSPHLLVWKGTVAGEVMGRHRQIEADRQKGNIDKHRQTQKGGEGESAPSRSLHKNGSLASYCLLLDDLNADLTKFLNGV